MSIGQRERAGVERVVALALGIVVLAGAALAATHLLPAADFTSVRVPWLLLFALFVVTELLVIHIELRGDVQTVSLSEVPLILGLFTLAPLDLIVMHMAATVVVLIVRPQVWYKSLFNLALTAGSAAIAAALFQVIAASPLPKPGPPGWLAAWAAVALTSLFDGSVIGLAVRASGGAVGMRDLREMWVVGVLGTTATSGLGLIAVALGELYPVAGTLVVFIVTGVLFASSRGYARMRERHEKLEQLHGLTQLANRAPDFGHAVDAILTEAQGLLRTRRAELVWAGSSTAPQRFVKVGDAPLEQTAASSDGLLRRVLGQGNQVLLPRGSSEAGGWLDRHGARDLLIVPLRQGDGVVGALSVLDRLGDIVTFDEEDAKVLATFAQHATMALDNALLLDELRREAEDKRHQARHDGLTGLPNRTLLYERLAEAIEGAGRSHQRVAVVVLDVDRFKEVNDTLGHHHGDLLLRQVAQRLRGAMGEDVLLARLGGDEFALLVPAMTSASEALEVARRVDAAFEAPFDTDGLSLRVSASMGVAIAPDHGSRAEVVLQRADVAMYKAKNADGVSVHLYEPASDQSSARRLAMAGALREAISAEAIDLTFQPKADLATGAIVGVEALARWNDPTFGQVPPDEFIGLAEHAGLIRSLTRLVLIKALRQQRAWEAAGYPLVVAVNLSARSLSDTGLADEVAELLVDERARPDRLVLEITESEIMRDPERALLTLQRLRDLGVDLSIDDFGTGHSSLAYLKHLPVDEVKIDRSFVTEVAVDGVDASIVRAIVDVAGKRGLRVVAEGVENAEMWAALVALGCDVAQGYHLTRPLDAENLTRWLDGRVLADGQVAGVRRPRGGRPYRVA